MTEELAAKCEYVERTILGALLSMIGYGFGFGGEISLASQIMADHWTHPKYRALQMALIHLQHKCYQGVSYDESIAILIVNECGGSKMGLEFWDVMDIFHEYRNGREGRNPPRGHPERWESLMTVETYADILIRYREGDTAALDVIELSGACLH